MAERADNIGTTRRPRHLSGAWTGLWMKAIVKASRQESHVTISPMADEQQWRPLKLVASSCTSEILAVGMTNKDPCAHYLECLSGRRTGEHIHLRFQIYPGQVEQTARDLEIGHSSRHGEAFQQNSSCLHDWSRQQPMILKALGHR
jgi:hypothetical protein